MRDNDIIERLHKAYDAKEPDVLPRLDFSGIEMVSAPEKNIKKRYLSAVAVYAAACLVVAMVLPFIIGGGEEPVKPKPQPGMSMMNTETVATGETTRDEQTTDAPDTEVYTSEDVVTTDPYDETVSIDYYPIPVETTEAEVPTPEDPEPVENTTTSKRFDPVGTSTTKRTEPDPAPKVYDDPANHVRVRFYKDRSMTDEYKSAADIPYAARVYYKIETDPGYICTNFSINVYGVGCDEIKDGLVGTNYYPFFDNNYTDGKPEYSVTAVLAGDADGNLTYDQSDVDTLNKYLDGDTTTRWLYGIDGYSEKLDYNCDGVINVNDRMQLQSEISKGAADRRAMPYHKYAKAEVGTITYRLPLNINSVLPHGISIDRALNHGTYDVYKDTASISGLSAEIRAKYDDAFFEIYDLVLVYCYTEDGEVPINYEELDAILCTESRSDAVLNPVIPEVKPGETLSEYAICIAAAKRLNIVGDDPL